MSLALMEGIETDDPTVARAPGSAEAPVVPNTLAVTRKPLESTSATDCCWLE